MATKGDNPWRELARGIGRGLAESAREQLEAYRKPPLAPPALPAPPPATLDAWARANGVAVRLPVAYRRTTSARDLGLELDFKSNPCIDFGKHIERVPRFVLRPKSQSQLAACLSYLSQERVPFKVRAAGHSSGGQVLIDGGAVLDVSGLDRLVKDAPRRGLVRVEGGMWWSALMDRLTPQGRRPPVLTDNWHTSIAGTLAVGGFGDATHIRGLQIAHVEALTVYTLDGARHEVGPEDDLFVFTLAGRGQLGVVGEAAIRTIERPPTLTASLLRWRTVEDFVEDALQIAHDGRFEFFRSRVYWDRHCSVQAIAGNLQAQPQLDMALLLGLRASAGEVRQMKLSELGQEIGNERHWQRCWPCLEMMLPLPDGLATWRDIHRRLIDTGIHHALGRGASIMVVPTDLRRFPLAPFIDTPFNLLIALRPRFRRYLADRSIAELLDLRAHVLDAGGKIYLMSIEPVDGSLALENQFGEALPRFRELKRQTDPRGLLNPGLL